MKEKTTQCLLAIVALLLLAHLLRPSLPLPSAQAQAKETVPPVLRAEAFELVNKQGQVVTQLYTGEDGGGNIRLREGTGRIRVKLGATKDGAGLLLVDKDVEPAILLSVKNQYFGQFLWVGSP